MWTHYCGLSALETEKWTKTAICRTLLSKSSLSSTRTAHVRNSTENYRGVRIGTETMWNYRKYGWPGIATNTSLAKTCMEYKVSKNIPWKFSSGDRKWQRSKTSLKVWMECYAGKLIWAPGSCSVPRREGPEVQLCRRNYPAPNCPRAHFAFSAFLSAFHHLPLVPAQYGGVPLTSYLKCPELVSSTLFLCLFLEKDIWQTHLQSCVCVRRLSPAL